MLIMRLLCICYEYNYLFLSHHNLILCILYKCHIGYINECSISLRLDFKTRWLSMGAWENSASNIIVGLMMSLTIRYWQFCVVFVVCSCITNQVYTNA